VIFTFFCRNFHKKHPVLQKTGVKKAESAHVSFQRGDFGEMYQQQTDKTVI